MVTLSKRMWKMRENFDSKGVGAMYDYMAEAASRTCRSAKLNALYSMALRRSMVSLSIAKPCLGRKGL